MTDMVTAAVLQLHYTLGFLSTAGAFGVLAWSMVVLRWRRGYLTSPLMWVGNLLAYNLGLLVGLDGHVPFLGIETMTLWRQIVGLQGLLTVLFVCGWLIAERLPSLHTGGHTA